MEDIKTKENFVSFLNRISAVYNENGLTPELESEINLWHDRMYESTSMPGGAIEERVVFQIQLARIYIKIGKINSAQETLSDVWTQANQDRLTECLKEIDELLIICEYAGNLIPNYYTE